MSILIETIDFSCSITYRHSWQDGSVKAGSGEFDLDNVTVPLLLEDDHKVHLPTLGDLHHPLPVLETPKVLLVSLGQSGLLGFEARRIVTRQFVLADTAWPGPDGRGGRQQRDGVKIGLPFDRAVCPIEMVRRVGGFGRRSIRESDVFNRWNGQRRTGGVLCGEEGSHGRENDVDHGVGGRGDSQGRSRSDPAEEEAISEMRLKLRSFIDQFR